MPELGHFVFRGAPGTGKTTVARTMAKILFDLGLLPRNHVEQTSGLDLTGKKRYEGKFGQILRANKNSEVQISDTAENTLI